MKSQPNRQKTLPRILTMLTCAACLAFLVSQPAAAAGVGGSGTAGKSGWKDPSIRELLASTAEAGLRARPPEISGPEKLSVNSGEDLTWKYSLNGSNPDGGSLSWRISAAPLHGTAAVEPEGLNPQVSYTPEPDYSGQDVFTVEAVSPAGLGDTLSIALEIVPANDVPVSSDFEAPVMEDNALYFSVEDFTTRFSDPEGAALEGVLISPLPDHGGLFLGNKAVITGQTIPVSQLNLLHYLPDTDWHGSDAFGWAGTDGQQASLVQAIINLDVAPANDDPQITDDLDAPVVMDEDGAPQAFSLVLHAGDVDLVDSFTWSIAVLPEAGIAEVDPGGFEAAVRYTPEANFNGDDDFLVQVDDGYGGVDGILVHVVVRPVNDPPRVLPMQIELVEEKAYRFSQEEFMQNSADQADAGHLEAVRISALPAGGKLLLGDQTITAGQYLQIGQMDELVYQPDADFSGADSFAWAGCDSGDCSSAPATVNVLVENLPDPPAFPETSPAEVTLEEDSAPDGLIVAVEAVDPDPGDTVTYTLVIPPVHGEIRLQSDGANLELRYTPARDYSGPDVFTLQAADSSGKTAQHSVKVTIRPANDAPQMNALPLQVLEDSPLAFSPAVFTAAFSDPDGDLPAAFKLESLPGRGSLLLAGQPMKAGDVFDLEESASLVYQPAPGTSGMDYFRINASDGQIWAARGGLASITIAPAEDAPTLREAGEITLDLDAARLPGEPMLTLHGADADGDELAWVLATSPVFGALQASGEGYDLFLDYTPRPGFSGSDTFTIHLSDHHSAPAVVVVYVVGSANFLYPRVYIPILIR